MSSVSQSRVDPENAHQPRPIKNSDPKEGISILLHSIVDISWGFRHEQVRLVALWQSSDFCVILKTKWDASMLIGLTMFTYKNYIQWLCFWYLMCALVLVFTYSFWNMLYGNSEMWLLIHSKPSQSHHSVPYEFYSVCMLVPLLWLLRF